MTSQKIAIGLVALALFVGSMRVYYADNSAGSKTSQRGDSTTALRQLPDQGDAGVQFSLGIMYEQGQGVTQDYEEAVRWYRKAADQGNGEAQYAIGLMYAIGQGVARDYIQAHVWFNLAAERDLKPGRKRRDLLAKQMTPAQIAEAQRLAREWKPKGK